jgi:hypothetical protein
MQTSCTLTFRWGWLAIPGMLFLFGQPVLAGQEVFRAGPPVEIQQVRPPAEIQRVKPPAEIQKVKPPDEVQRVRPPSEIQRVKPPEDVRRGVPAVEIRQAPAQVRREVSQPDLRLRALGVSSTRPKVGERVVITARVLNSGDESARRAQVTFLAGDKEIASRLVDLPPGATEAVSASFIPDTPGFQPIRVQVDPGTSRAGAVTGTVTSGRTITVLADPDKAYAGTGQAPAAIASLAKKEEGSQAGLPPQQIPFDKPLLAKKGTEIARQPGGGSGSAGSPGSPPGSGQPGLHDPSRGLGDQPKGVPDTTLGSGPGLVKGDLGDGIMGVHDQGDLPKKDYEKGIPDPRKGPNHKTAGRGWGKDPYGQPVFKTPGEHDNGFKAGEKVFKVEVERAQTYFKAGVADEIKIKAVIFSGNPKEGTSKISFINKDGSTDTISFDKNGIPVAVKTTKPSKPSGSYPREDVEGKETSSSKEIFTDPLLIMKWIKITAPGERGDPRVSDPAPIKGSKAASGPEGAASAIKGGELAAAGAAKAEAKWRFAGKKPGSEVTDPVEWQDRKIRDFSMARMKHFEVIDPVEAPGLQGALAKAQASSASGATGQSVTVASVAGGMQKLATENGQQGWAPLKAGDSLGQGSIIRVESNTGGEVGVGNADTALPMNWQKIHSFSGHVVFLLSIKE